MNSHNTKFPLFLLFVQSTLLSTPASSYAKDTLVLDGALVTQSEERDRETRPQQAIVSVSHQSGNLPAIANQDQGNDVNKKITKNSVVPKKKRLTVEERRVLRRQIHDTGTELYGQARTNR